MTVASPLSLNIISLFSIQFVHLPLYSCLSFLFLLLGSTSLTLYCLIDSLLTDNHVSLLTLLDDTASHTLSKKTQTQSDSMLCIFYSVLTDKMIGLYICLWQSLLIKTKYIEL